MGPAPYFRWAKPAYAAAAAGSRCRASAAGREMHGGSAQAAELQVLGGGMTAPLKELRAQFESATGHRIVFRFGTTPELIKLTTSGGPFDLGVAPREVFQDAAAR